tara:strand:+ start:145 stop:642 length:498 start_codon:yes stop_codon:yes gene_type:complete
MNDLLKTLVKPDWDDNPKRSKILYASNLLEIGEFQLIQLAYKVWYKTDLPEHKINKIFSDYMVHGIIPIWVTYYANDIIKLDHVSKLNAFDDKYHVYDSEFGQYIPNKETRKKRGIFYLAIIVFVFFASHYMAATYVEEPAGFYPPYIEKKIVYPELYNKDGLKK